MPSIVRKLGVRRTMTPNQIVAYNVARARALRGWTQAEAGEHLAKYLGSKLSEASFSALERSATSVNRIKVFSADELLALSRGFDLPIGYFLTPPPPESDAAVHAPDAGLRGLDPIVLLNAVLGTPENLEHWQADLLAYSASTAPEPPSKREKAHVSPADLADRVDPLADLRAQALLRAALGETADAADVLERLADALRQLDAHPDDTARTSAHASTDRATRGGTRAVADGAARPGKPAGVDRAGRAGTPAGADEAARGGTPKASGRRSATGRS